MISSFVIIFRIKEKVFLLYATYKLAPSFIIWVITWCVDQHSGGAA